MPPTYAGLADPRAYVRLAAIVRQQITDGTLKAGQPAPPITRLSQEHGHARPTCGKALRRGWQTENKSCTGSLVRFSPQPATVSFND